MAPEDHSAPPPTPDDDAPEAPTARPTHARKRRYVVVVVSLVLLVALLAGVKYCQISSLIATGKQMERAGPPPEAVGSSIAQTMAWETTLPAVGSVTGAQSVVVSNELPGIVERIRFESGQVIERGRTLVELDRSTEQAQLVAARARGKFAGLAVRRATALVDAGAVPREQLDRARTELDSATSEIEALETQIEKKTVRAPFAGRLGIRAVNVGQFLAPGTEITRLDSTRGLFVDFALPQEQLGSVRVGAPVQIELQTKGETITGTLAAIDPTLDADTRNLRLRAEVTDGAERLRPGMFVRVAVVMPQRPIVVIVPQTAIIHAAYGDSVFVVEPKPPGSPGMAKTPAGKQVQIARQQFVRLGSARGDFIVIREGVKAGQQVVTAGAFKLRNGAPIVVDNSVQPSAQLDPRPENR